MSIPALVLTYIILQVTDIQITDVVIRNPLIREANPLYYILGWDGLILCKTISMLATSIFITFCSMVRWREIKWATKAVAWLVVIISALPIISNLLVAWRHN